MEHYLRLLREEKDSMVNLLFNELHHKYMDTNGNLYTSMTTVIGKFIPEFPKVKIAKAVTRKRDSKYYGWNYLDVLKDWERITNISLDRGNKTHNDLESITKRSTNFKFDSKLTTINNNKYYTLYTVDDIVNDTLFGELDPLVFLGTGIRNKYPRIYNLFMILASQGYKFYSEIGVYSEQLLISGLIDILCVNHAAKVFIIVDWKTNKHDLIPNDIEENKYRSGYFKKDSNGNETNLFVYTDQYFYYPLNNHQTSHYMTYAFQLNGYANLFASKGYTLKQLILVHVRDNEIVTPESTDKEEYIGKARVDLHNIEFYQNEVDAMFKYFANNMSNQTNIFQ